MLALARDGILSARAVYVAAVLGIPDLLADGPKDAEELARATDAHAPSLGRVLRFLAGLGVFAEDARGRFRLTPVGATLRSDRPRSLRALSIFWNEDYHWAAFGDILHSVRTGGTAIEHLFGMPIFEFFGKRPGSARTFDAAMTAVSERAVPEILAAYDFRGIRVLVDVGGGHGTLLSGILAAHPRMRGILFDLPPVVAGARERLERLPAGDRIKTVAGDMFASVPAGGDAYIMKLVIHDWDDDRALQLLKNCRTSMGRDARLLLVEGIVSPRNVPGWVKELDIEMLLMTGGRERTLREFQDLLDRAGFRLRRAYPTRLAISVLEAVPKGSAPRSHG
jgi:hypothetical protein